ncbi:hypothetical protein PUNSTDRAFT_55205 [Punctularia strigosozonata HHB-11173 SS5]|uniref:Uncharacterized protein n=1 Tax=Punctularia strigosozonata (strain HHB-11173) TaxID=741275 RepID=R7S370_PUNST|nr:uncharacterized protein PUNSTDRAFT_55205 [Punctularia strigosozonata HHB-11173 SS5]EIN04845.1 hypothetical protein PUNSTDRAFT_55205 [Punctularia strigosozonata HHB-11173 SS5]
MSAFTCSSSQIIHGYWTKSKTQEQIRDNDVLVTAVREASAPEATLASPAPAHVTSSARSHPQDQELDGTDAVDDFFGFTRTTRPRPLSSTSDLPPPYPTQGDLPAYSIEEQHEPVTLAMHLFKYGFLFPPFWIIGTIVLFCSLNAPADWHSEKTDLERQQLLTDIRVAERRWAKRCAYALIALTFFVIIAVIIALAVLKWSS